MGQPRPSSELLGLQAESCVVTGADVLTLKIICHHTFAERLAAYFSEALNYTVFYVVTTKSQVTCTLYIRYYYLLLIQGLRAEKYVVIIFTIPSLKSMVK